MALLTLYARREPSLSRECRRHDQQLFPPSKGRDVVLYRDKEATHQVAFYPWYLASRPNRRSKHVMHNCFRYRLEWFDDLVFENSAEMAAYRNTRRRFWPGARVVPVSDVNGERALMALLW